MDTNYTDTFIQVAEDCPAVAAEAPPRSPDRPSIAAVQHALLSERPYGYTSDELLFEVHVVRNGIGAEGRDAEWRAFSAKSHACLRASPLAKRYGWGFHHDSASHVALVPLGSEQYERLAGDAALAQRRAMRSKR